MPHARPLPAQRGAALLLAMLTVTLVATLAASAMWRQWRGVEVEAAERARAQSAWLLNGALDWGRLILAGDLRESGPVDHLGEPWAVPLAEARLSTFLAAGEADDAQRRAFLSGQITDLQSRLNALNLVAGNEAQQRDALIRFNRLFDLLGLPASELGLLQRNLLRAWAAHAPAAEQPPQQADAPLLPRRFDELAWLGLSPQSLSALAPYLTVVPLSGNTESPNPTPVNLNTASAQVIYAATPGLDMAAAQQLVAQRSRTYFRSAQDAIASLGRDGLDGDGLRWLSVNTQFFEIRGRLRLDQLALEEVSAVHRDNNRRVHTLWRQRSTLSLPADAQSLSFAPPVTP